MHLFGILHSIENYKFSEDLNTNRQSGVMHKSKTVESRINSVIHKFIHIINILKEKKKWIKNEGLLIHKLHVSYAPFFVDNFIF